MELVTADLLALLKRGLRVALVLVIGLLAVKVLLVLTKKFLEKSPLDAAVHRFLYNMVRIALVVILVVAVLSELDVPTAPLVTVLGACGAAIALALKDSLGNIAGGLLILANKPFRKGDLIDAAGIQGVVENIDLFVTTLKTLDNKVITVPNGTLNTSVITNYSREEMRRVDLRFGVSYDTDLTRAKNVLLACAAAHPDVREDPAPFAGVASHGDSAVFLDLRVWCDTEQVLTVQYDLQEQVKEAFDAAGIRIPFPQMDVHVDR